MRVVHRAELFSYHFSTRRRDGAEFASFINSPQSKLRSTHSYVIILLARGLDLK